MTAHNSTFDTARRSVEPPDDDVANAAAAHKTVREELESDETLSGWGIDTLLIGSYARQVSIRRIKDVDVFSMLESAPSDIDPREVLDHFAEVLTDKFGDERVDMQDRSVKVEFPDFDLCVDAVPAIPSGDHWQIPDRTERGSSWQETDPLELGRITTELNSRYDGRYVPIVKLIRQTRRTALGKRPGGLVFEVLAYHAFDAGLDGTSIPELYVAALGAIAGQLDEVVAGAGINDPSQPGKELVLRVTAGEWSTAALRFRQIATAASEALASLDECASAKTFHDILGQRTDDDEWVFPMPDYCNADGTKKAGTAGERTVPGAGTNPRWA